MSMRKRLRAAMSVVCVTVALACAGCGRSSAGGEPEPVRAAPPSAAVARPATPRALQLQGTAVHELVAQGSGRKYEVWVALPASYDEGNRTYPVVFVTDALYSFPLVRSIRNLLGQRDRNIEDFILVGLPPQTGLTSKASRSRDYTPSNPLLDPRNRNRPDSYSAEHYGEAAAFRDYIERQVFPLIAGHYRADMTRKVFAGHSLGGLFGSYVLLTRPAMFQHYILGSPSLWFDKRSILRHEQDYARDHRDLPAKVMMYTGMYETYGPDPRNFKDVDMVGDMRAFERLLESRRYPGLSVDSQVIADEDHLSVFPALISRGLLWALPGHGPYSSG